MRSCRAEPHRKPIRRFHRPLGFCLCSSSAGGSPLSLSSSLRCCYYYDHQLCSYCCCCCCFCLNHDWMCRDYAHDKHHATGAHRKHARHTAMPARAEREVSPSACASVHQRRSRLQCLPTRPPSRRNIMWRVAVLLRVHCLGALPFHLIFEANIISFTYSFVVVDVLLLALHWRCSYRCR
jgi:hypothetical protein